MYEIFQFLADLHIKLGFDTAVGEVFQDIADALNPNK